MIGRDVAFTVMRDLFDPIWPLRIDVTSGRLVGLTRSTSVGRRLAGRATARRRVARASITRARLARVATAALATAAASALAGGTGRVPGVILVVAAGDHARCHEQSTKADNRKHILIHW